MKLLAHYRRGDDVVTRIGRRRPGGNKAGVPRHFAPPTESITDHQTTPYIIMIVVVVVGDVAPPTGGQRSATTTIRRIGGRVQLASDFGKRLRAAISCHLTQTGKESA